MSARKTFLVGGEPQERCLIEFKGNSPLCEALARRYPGIRFSLVSIVVRHDEWMRAHPDAETADVYFSLQGAPDSLGLHGFDRPTFRTGCALRKGAEMHLTNARYPDGLERIALLQAPALLERFQRARRAQP